MVAYTSTQTGDFDDINTWGGGGFPGTGDTATIANTHIVSVKGNEACGNITVNIGGTLRMEAQPATDAQLTLDNGATLLNNGTVDGSGTGGGEVLRVIGTSLEACTGTDWNWDNQVWVLRSLDFQFNITIGGGISQSITFDTSLSTLDDITVGAGATVNFSVDNCTATACTVNASDAVLNINNPVSVTSFNQTNGTTTPASSSTAITCSGNWTVTAGTWTDGRGQVTIDATGNLRHSINSANRTNTFEQSGAITSTMTGFLYCLSWFRGSATGTLNGSGQRLQIGTSGSNLPFDHNGVTVGSGLNIAIISNFPTPTLDSGTYHHLELSGSGGGVNFTQNGAITCNGLLAIANSSALLTTTASNYNITCADATITNGTLTGNDAVLTSTGTCTVSGGTLTFTGSTGKLDVANFAMASGTCTPSSTTSEIRCSGNWLATGGTWTDSLGELTLTGTGNFAQQTTNNGRIYSLYHSGTTTTTMTNNVRIRHRHIMVSTTTIDSPGAFLWQTGTMGGPGTFTMPSGATITGALYKMLISTSGTLTAAGTFEDLELTTSVDTYTLGANLTCTGSLDLDGGGGLTTLDTSVTNYAINAGNITLSAFTDIIANASTLTLTGNWDTSLGTFTQGTSTAVFNGTGSAISVKADAAGEGFYNWTLNAGKTATFNTDTGFLCNNAQATILTAGVLTIADGVTAYLSNIGMRDFNSVGTVQSVAEAGSGVLAFRHTVSYNMPTTLGTLNVNCSILHFSAETTEKITLQANFTCGQVLDITAGGGNAELDTSLTNYSINCGGMVTNSNGTLTANGSTITSSGSVDLSNGTFTYGSSNLVMTGNGTTLTCNGTTSRDLNNLTISNNVAVVNASNNTRITTGVLTIGAFTFTLTNTFQIFPTAANLSFNVNTVLAGPGSFEMSANGDTQTIDASFGVNHTAPVLFRNYSGISAYTLGGNIATTGSITMTATAAATFTVDAATFTAGAGDFTVGSDCTYDGGTNTTTAAGNVDMSNGTFTRGTSTFRMTGTDKTFDFHGSDARAYHGLEFTGSADVRITATGQLDVHGHMKIETNAHLDINFITYVFVRDAAALNPSNVWLGSLDTDTHLFCFYMVATGNQNGNIDLSGLTVTGTGAIEFRAHGNIDQDWTVTLTGNIDTGTAHLQIKNLDDTFGPKLDAATFNVDCTNLSLTDTGGAGAAALVLDGGSGTITASGNVNFSAGTFTYDTSTLVMTGTGKTFTTGAVSRTFYNITISGTITQTGDTCGVTNAYDGNSTFTVNGSRLQINATAVPLFDNTGGTIAGLGDLIFVSVASDVTIPAGQVGTITIANTRFQIAGIGDVLLGSAFTTTGSVDVRDITGTGGVWNTNNQAVNCADLSFFSGFSPTIEATSSVITASGNVNMTDGMFTYGTSEVKMTGTSKTLTVTTTARAFHKLTVTGTATFTSPGFTAAPQIRNAFTNTGTATLASCNLQIYTGTSIGNFSSTAIVNSGTVSTITLFPQNVNSTWSNIGSITNVNVTLEALGGSTNSTVTLGDNLSLTTGGILTVRNNGGSNATLDSDTFDIDVAGTTSVQTGATVRTGANASGASWTFNGTLTVGGTMQATVTPAVGNEFVVNLASAKTMTVRDILVVAGHADAGDAVFTTGGTGDVDQRNVVTGGEIQRSTGVDWNGLYVVGAKVSQLANMRGAWFGICAPGSMRHNTPMTVQSFGHRGVKRAFRLRL
jgi:hypothetical protein